jgi:hypothetical protein
MKRAFLCAPLLAAILVYPPRAAEVEIANEPHHHFLFANEAVRVFDVEVGPQEATLMHRHRHDYVFVTLGATEVSNEVEGKSPVRLTLQDGETRFVPGGFAHVARDFASKPFRNVTVEFLQDQKAHSSPPPQWDEDRGLKVFTGGTQHILFVEDGVRASEIELQTGAMIPIHHPPGACLLVAINDLEVRSAVQGVGAMPGRFQSGDAQWLPGGDSQTLTNTGKQIAKFVTLEFP